MKHFYLQYSSDSDEQGFLEKLQSKRRKSLRQTKKKQELKKKWNERKRQRYVASKIAASGDDDSEAREPHTEREISRNKTSEGESKDNTSKVNKSHTENPQKRDLRRKREKKTSKDDSEVSSTLIKNPTRKRKISRSRKTIKTSEDNDSEANESHTENPPKNLRGKKRKKASKDDSETSSPLVENPKKSLRGKKNVASISKVLIKIQQSIDKNSEDDTPKVRNTLKQTKLNFRVNSVTSPVSAEKSVFSPNSSKSGNKKDKLFTSTPLSHRHTGKMPYLETINITEIEKPNKSTSSTSRVLRNSAQKKKPLRKSLRLSRLSRKSVHFS